MSEENVDINLNDIINSALAELSDPERDTPLAADVEVEEVIEADEEVEAEGDLISGEEPEDFEDDDEEASEDYDEETSDEEEPEASFYDEKVVVKVDGEEQEITVKEAVEGYQRREDYTRKTQELSEARQAFEQEIQQFADTIENVEAFESAWSEDPAGVISRLAAGTDNPTQALVLTIKNLAAEKRLEKEFLDIFGITDDVLADWSREAELSQARLKVSSYEKRESEAQAELEQQAAVQDAVARYEAQIDNIIKIEGLVLDAEGRAEFTRKVADYAFKNNLTNLEAARKAMLFDESQAKRQVAEQTKQRASQKRKAGAVTRTGSTGNGSPVGQEPSDLRSLIESTMRELN